MKILADENVDAPIIDRLRADGHDVVAIGETSPGIVDTVVLARAVSERRTLLTADRDFGDIILRDAQTAPQDGVVLFRLRQAPVGEKSERISRILSETGSRIAGAFVVIERDRVRRRRL